MIRFLNEAWFTRSASTILSALLLAIVLLLSKLRDTLSMGRVMEFSVVHNGVGCAIVKIGKPRIQPSQVTV